MLITLGTVNQVFVFIQATITFKVVLLVLGKCTINPTLWTLRSSIQRNEGRDQQTTQALKHLPVYRRITQETTVTEDWRQPHHSSYCTGRTGAGNEVSTWKSWKNFHLLVCKYQWNPCGSTYSRGFHNITTKERLFLKCIQAQSLCSISYKMVPLSEWDIHCLKEWNLTHTTCRICQVSSACNKVLSQEK